MKLFKKWNFVLCNTQSQARRIMASYVKLGTGTQYKLTVIDNAFGFKWR